MCISQKVPLVIDPFYNQMAPFITGKTKYFYGFLSICKNIKQAYNFLGASSNNKEGTIFSFSGKLWGYDISLFNYFEEEEILLEPERKFLIEEIFPEINKIIIIRAQFKENTQVLKDNLSQDSITLKYKNSTYIRLFGREFVSNNKNICKIIFNGKELELKETFNPGYETQSDEFMEIQLKNISKITNLSYMFSNCDIVDIPYIQKWDTSNVTNMNNMFSDNSSYSFTSLPDISKLNTRNVIYMKEIFKNCCEVESLPDISKWNTSKVKYMNGMFSECKKLSSLPNISNWNTSNVEEMNDMFLGCENLKNLPDISNWNTNNVSTMCKVFA